MESPIRVEDLIATDRTDEVGRFCIPIPPHLETFVFKNYCTKLQYNQTLCLNPFNRSSNLKHVDISNSNLNFNVSSRFGVSGLQNLQFLNLQGNGMNMVEEPSIFSNMTSLNVLLLGGNTVGDTFIEKDLPQLINLTILDLGNCGIKKMPAQSLSMLRNLRILNLTGNGLRDFDVNISSLKYLEEMNLSLNQIETLGKNTMRHLGHRMSRGTRFKLDLSRNPLRCSCEGVDFLRWLQHIQSTRPTMCRRCDSLLVRHHDLYTKLYTKQRVCRGCDLKLHDLTCSHPTWSVISPLKVDVGELYRQCIHFNAIISSIVSSIGVAVVAACIGVVYKRRWRIRYWLYAVRTSWRRRRVYEGLIQQNNYVYDAFVAYSSQGEERSWVHTTLREKLENEHGLKLCMYHRDFKAGRDLADTIVEAINSSRKTLIILSPSFLKSGWCEFEVKMANEKIKSERRDSLVVIIFKRLDEAGTKCQRS